MADGLEDRGSRGAASAGAPAPTSARSAARSAYEVPATPAEVEQALAAEARALDARCRGTHVFEGVYPVAGNRRCNWSATYHVRGGALPLAEMRAAIERVQALMPIMKFEPAETAEPARTFEPFLLNDG